MFKKLFLPNKTVPLQIISNRLVWIAMIFSHISAFSARTVFKQLRITPQKKSNRMTKFPYDHLGWVAKLIQHVDEEVGNDEDGSIVKFFEEIKADDAAKNAHQTITLSICKNFP